MTSLVRRCHPERSEAQSRDPADLPDRFFAQDSPLWKTGLAYFFMRSSTAAIIPIIPVRIVGSGNRCEFTRMQGRQFLPRLFELRDLRRIDCAEVKINRRNGVVRQAVFGKIFTAHHWIDDLDIFVA